MKNFTPEEIDIILTEASEKLLEKGIEFNEIELDDNQKLIVNIGKIDKSITYQSIEINEKKLKVPIKLSIEYQQGNEIVELIGKIDEDQMFADKSIRNLVGGMACGTESNPGYFGTLSIFCNEVEYGFDWNVFCGKFKGKKQLISNNHVLVKDDSSSYGENIWCGSIDNNVAKLSNYIPFSCTPRRVDFASAETLLTNIDYMTIQSIGPVTSNFIEPNKGMPIKKFGASSQFTTGNVEDKVSIRVSGKGKFFLVWRTSKGFSKGGDSGSMVVNSDNNIIGLIAWGVKDGNWQNNKSYFWSLKKPGQIYNEGGTGIYIK